MMPMGGIFRGLDVAYWHTAEESLAGQKSSIKTLGGSRRGHRGGYETDAPYLTIVMTV
jgi:hypothetical protein